MVKYLVLINHHVQEHTHIHTNRSLFFLHVHMITCMLTVTLKHFSSNLKVIRQSVTNPHSVSFTLITKIKTSNLIPTAFFCVTSISHDLTMKSTVLTIFLTNTHEFWIFPVQKGTKWPLFILFKHDPAVEFKKSSLPNCYSTVVSLFQPVSSFITPHDSPGKMSSCQKGLNILQEWNATV